MAVPLIESTASLALLLEENLFTTTRLAAQSMTAPIAVDFEAFQTAVALLLTCDEDLDRLVDRVEATVLRLSGGDPEHALHAKFFGARPRRDLQRPLLAGKLDAIRAWLSPMQSSEHMDLVALSGDLERFLLAADAAVFSQAGAEGTIRDFRSAGQREALIDKYNAIRRAAESRLAELREERPDEDLPADFAEQFFRKAPLRGPEPGMPAREEVIARMAVLEDELTELREALAAIDAQAQAEAALIEAKVAAEEAKAKVAELEARRGIRAR